MNTSARELRSDADAATSEPSVAGSSAGQWRTIDSAPKDGTEIILGATAQLFGGKPTEPRSTVGHWTTDEESRVYLGDCGGECRCPEYEEGEQSWLSWDGGFTEENPPTHWQPLPQPPLLAGGVKLPEPVDTPSVDSQSEEAEATNGTSQKEPS